MLNKEEVSLIVEKLKNIQVDILNKDRPMKWNDDSMKSLDEVINLLETEVNNENVT